MLKSTNLLAGYIVSGKQEFLGSGSPIHAQPQQLVGITISGWNRHLRNHKMRNLGLIGLGGALLSVVAVGGGIGLAMGGEAIGIGALEQFVAGGIASTVTGAAVPQRGSNVGGCTQMQKMNFSNMLGRVLRVRQRQSFPWEATLLCADYICEIRWSAINHKGNRINFTAWHDPNDLWPVHKMTPVAC